MPKKYSLKHTKMRQHFGLKFKVKKEKKINSLEHIDYFQRHPALFNPLTLNTQTTKHN